MTEENNYRAVTQVDADAHWKENVGLVSWLLLVWFVVTWVVALLANQLNSFSILGFPMGYTFGSLFALLIYTVMIFYYAHRMEQIDAKYGMKE
ncbi:MAG: DUF4212 domain-containing protein [Clostridiales bacterium]|jgi:putative solute:sodium symporter small subunit|nr:DUF4212 domain-containing protein [Clostridiales bacterium]